MAVTINSTLEKVVQSLGGSVKFRKTPNGKDLYVRYNPSSHDEDYLEDISVPPYSVYIEISSDDITETYIVPIKTFVLDVGKARGNEEAFEAFLYNIFASIF